VLSEVNPLLIYVNLECVRIDLSLIGNIKGMNSLNFRN
jgi:hypothetical protein